MGVSRQDGAPIRNYSTVNTRERAQRLVEQGELVALLMMPELFGGDDRDENVVFVPPATADRKAEIDKMVILPLVQAGKVVEYRVEPVNDRRSFVPLALNITASSPEPHVFCLVIWEGSGP